MEGSASSSFFQSNFGFSLIPCNANSQMGSMSRFYCKKNVWPFTKVSSFMRERIRLCRPYLVSSKFWRQHWEVIHKCEFYSWWKVDFSTDRFSSTNLICGTDVNICEFPELLAPWPVPVVMPDLATDQFLSALWICPKARNHHIAKWIAHKSILVSLRTSARQIATPKMNFPLRERQRAPAKGIKVYPR